MWPIEVMFKGPTSCRSLSFEGARLYITMHLRKGAVKYEHEAWLWRTGMENAAPHPFAGCKHRQEVFLLGPAHGRRRCGTVI